MSKNVKLLVPNFYAAPRAITRVYIENGRIVTEIFAHDSVAKLEIIDGIKEASKTKPQFGKYRLIGYIGALRKLRVSYSAARNFLLYGYTIVSDDLNDFVCSGVIPYFFLAFARKGGDHAMKIAKIPDTVHGGFTITGLKIPRIHPEVKRLIDKSPAIRLNSDEYIGMQEFRLTTLSKGNIRIYA